MPITLLLFLIQFIVSRLGENNSKTRVAPTHQGAYLSHLFMEEKDSRSEKVFLVGMILSMACWGFSWTAGKIISSYGDPLTISLLRFLITFLSLLVIIGFLKDRVKIKRQGLLHLAAASVLISLYTYLFFKGLVNGKAGFGGVLVTVLNPIMSYGIMLFIARRLPNKKEALGLLLGLAAGMVLLKIPMEAVNVFDAGNVYFLLAAFTWALLSWVTSKGKYYGSSVAFSLWMYGISTVIMMILAGTSSPLEVIRRSDLLFWGNMLFSSTITTAMATTFYFVATSKLGASRASSFIFMVPFSAALGSFIFLHEVIEWHTIVGGLLGIAAVYILNRK